MAARTSGLGLLAAEGWAAMPVFCGAATETLAGQPEFEQARRRRG